MEQLYTNIKRIRKERGLTQDNLADLVGYSANTMIARIENGKVDLPWSKILKFAEVFEISVLELMGFASPDRIQKINELPPQGVSYLHEQLEFAEYHWGRK